MAKKLDTKRSQTAQEIAETMDVDTNTVYRWIREGCPASKVANRQMLNESEVAAWMKSKNITGEVGKPTQPVNKDIAAAKLRKENAMARNWELTVAERESKLVEKEKVEAANVKKFTTIRAKLDSLPATLSPRLEGLTAAEIEPLLRDEIEECLHELSQM